ncbi:MAG TPA: hypothetical protein VGH30_08315 [Jatrophihabitantaceae bacterium]
MLTTMYTGLAATVAATVAPAVDRVTSDSLADHVRAGYPTYSRARVDTAATTYLVYLSIVGMLGVVAWLWTIHAVRTDKRWSRGATTAIFAVGISVALTDLLIKDTSGETGLPPLLGWIGMMPCLPGLIVVTMLWRMR